MNDLLKLAVEAHGGLGRWNQLSFVKANVSITGAIWAVKGQPDVLKDVQIEATLHEQALTMHLLGKNRRNLFTPHRVVIETESGDQVGTRNDPRASFQGHRQETPWDDLHVAYFANYALWTYLTIPFLYTYPGFACEELPPWQEEGEVWRPLKVSFSDHFPSHTREQISYFGPDGLLRRHEYTVDIMGGAPGLNYAAKYRNADGILVPTQRRVYAYNEKKEKIPEPVLVAIDIHHITFG
jgi:hypothetical protein